MQQGFDVFAGIEAAQIQHVFFGQIIVLAKRSVVDSVDVRSELRIGGKVNRAHVRFGHVQMLNDVAATGVRIGEDQGCAARGRTNQPGVHSNQRPATILRQQQRNEIVNGHDDGHARSQRRRPVRHVQQIGLIRSGGARHDRLLEEQLAVVGRGPLEIRR